jgi:hypothetical protein
MAPLKQIGDADRRSHTPAQTSCGQSIQAALQHRRVWQPGKRAILPILDEPDQAAGDQVQRNFIIR